MTRRVAAAALLCGACAFPPSFTPLGLLVDEEMDAGTNPDGTVPCTETCATCLDNRCLESGEAGACDPAGGDPRCDGELVCVDAKCVARKCADGVCDCPVACAGRCEHEACVPASPGEKCDPSGSGAPCLVGATCVRGVCTSTETDVPADEYRAQLASAVCRALMRCVEWPSDLPSACESTLFPEAPLFQSTSAALQAVGHAQATFDAALAGLCLQDLAAAGCPFTLPDACARVFSGGGTEGSDCTADASCARGLFCQRADFSGVSCSGTCAPRIAVFGSCEGSTPCAEDLICLGPTNVRLCRPAMRPGRLGERCRASRPGCEAGLACGPLGTCVAERRRGEACVAGECAASLLCATAAGGPTCQPPGADGAACSDDSACVAPTALLVSRACRFGRCGPLPGAGEAAAAGTALPDRCDPSLAWVDEHGVCEALQPAEGACLATATCGVLTGRVCSFGACRDPFVCE